MRIERYYSHLNGYEHLQVHKPQLWEEIVGVIDRVDAQGCKTKASKEKTKHGKILYSPKEMNSWFKMLLEGCGWTPSRTDYWVTADHKLIRRTIGLDAAAQKAEIEAGGAVPIASYNQTDFIKDRVQIEVQFGKYSFVAFDMFVKHMAFFVGDKMDVGIEILPMKSLQDEMSSGVPYYERGLYMTSCAKVVALLPFRLSWSASRHEPIDLIIFTLIPPPLHFSHRPGGRMPRWILALAERAARDEEETPKAGFAEIRRSVAGLGFGAAGGVFGAAGRGSGGARTCLTPQPDAGTQGPARRRCAHHRQHHRLLHHHPQSDPHADRRSVRPRHRRG
ncbi:MAG TPA: BglII/BstYI family type II restriction endonuclease [Tepidisphaeraceae bacterium]|jgi:hypothetical protein|nr:BglII/BstYI family type II restriction endonuclease [Tepidisphaeraceae bacterium]